MAELERNLSSHEKEVRSQASKLQELHTQLNQTRKELAERDRDLTKTGHELTQANERQQQTETKVGDKGCFWVFFLLAFIPVCTNMSESRECDKKKPKLFIVFQCSSVEQKLKQVTDEMNCQRHNAESCRRALEQKLKDKERDSQKVRQQLAVSFILSTQTFLESC